MFILLALLALVESSEASVAPVVAADTQVTIRIVSALSSKTNRPDDRFTIELATPILRDGVTIMPAGVRGEGEVVHAEHAKWGGRPGELIVAARFVSCGAVRVPLGKFRWSETGQDRGGKAIAAGLLLTPAVFLVNGGEVRVPAGTLATARVTASVTLPANGGCAPAAE